jgi:hypothetical protein
MEWGKRMARPKKLTDDLTNFNTKLQESDKKLIQALTQVTPYSQRELIEEMLKLYEERNPGTVEKARQLLKLKGGE